MAVTVAVGAALLVGPHAEASNLIDHGSTIEGGCGAYWSATPDPATSSNQLTLEIDFGCAPYAWISYPAVSLLAANPLQGEAAPLSCADTASYSVGGSVTCVYPPQPPGLYTASFSWGIVSNYNTVPTTNLDPFAHCVGNADGGGAFCSADLHVVVKPT